MSHKKNKARSAMPTKQEVFDFYKKTNPHSSIMRLMEKNSLAVWESEELCAHVMFIKASQSEIEEVLAEVSDKGSGSWKIDTEGRDLEGMSFRADDATGTTYYVLAIADKPGFEGIPVLAHEAVHTAVKILCDRKLPLDCDDSPDSHSEPMAYLVGSLVGFGLRTFYPDTNLGKILGPVDTKCLINYQKHRPESTKMVE